MLSCESLLQQCGFALIASFGAVVTALVSIFKAHEAQHTVKQMQKEKEEEKN